MKSKQNLRKRKASTKGRPATKRRRISPETLIKEEHCTEINIKVEVLQCGSEISEPLREEDVTRRVEETKFIFEDNPRAEQEFHFNFEQVVYPQPGLLEDADHDIEGYLDEPIIPCIRHESIISKTFQIFRAPFLIKLRVVIRHIRH